MQQTRPKTTFPIPISWEPEKGWLILVPSKLPNMTEAGLELPESFIQKNNAGICVKISTHPADDSYEHFIDRECFFPMNQEYRVKDSDTDQLYYVILGEHIIMSRTPPKKTAFVRVSQEKGEDVAA